MLTTNKDDFRVVEASVAGRRPVDRATQVSLTTLGERLERLKQSSRLFAGVVFSEHVARMVAPKAVSAAG